MDYNRPDLPSSAAFNVDMDFDNVTYMHEEMDSAFLFPSPLPAVNDARMLLELARQLADTLPHNVMDYADNRQQWAERVRAIALRLDPNAVL
jgi:hypothetical protein